MSLYITISAFTWMFGHVRMRVSVFKRVCVCASLQLTGSKSILILAHAGSLSWALRCARAHLVRYDIYHRCSSSLTRPRCQRPQRQDSSPHTDKTQKAETNRLQSSVCKDNTPLLRHLDYNQSTINEVNALEVKKGI